MRLLALCLLIVMTSSSCTFMPMRNVRTDPRAAFPEARPFGSAQSLPGDVPAAASDLRGAWLFRQTLSTDDPIFGGGRTFTNARFVALWLWLRNDGTYDIVYQAYSGARALNSPSTRAIDVRESGRFSISGDSLSLEPETTRAVEVYQGSRQRRTLADEPRAYLARIDGGYLNLAGPCATYQIEPICREAAQVWFSMRSVSTGSPDDVPEP